MDIYGLPDKDRKKIVEERQLDSKKWLTVPWSNRQEMQPTEGQYIAAGWLLKVVPVRTTFQRQGAVIIGEVAGEYTYALDDWSLEEIASHNKRISAEELKELKLNSEYLVWFIGKTNADIDAKIDKALPHTGNATLDGVIDNFRAVQKEQSYVDRDVAELFKALKDLGHF